MIENPKRNIKGDHAFAAMRRKMAGPFARRDANVMWIEEDETVTGEPKSYRFRENFFPTALKVGTKNKFSYTAVPFDRADLLLVDVIHDYSLMHVDTFVDYCGSVIAVRAVPGTNGTAIYYKVDQELRPMTRNILSILARHFLNDRLFYYNDVCGMRNLSLNMTKGQPKFRIKMIDLPNLVMSKISGAHHVHYTAVEVFKSLDREQATKAFQALRLPADSTTTFVAGVALWLSQLDDALYSLVINSDILDSADMKEYCRKAKKMSVLAKSYQNLVPFDLKPIFEAEVLANRAEGEVDWEQEKENRQRPKLACVSEEVVFKKALELFLKQDSGREKPIRMKWDKFWRSRWQWSATGSIHSQYQDDLKYVQKERELSNKFIALSTMPDQDLGHFLNRKPEIRAWSSVKYEWGKLRAIYGTDVTSYVLTHFAFYNCEDTLPSDFPVGRKARPSFVRRRVKATLEGVVPLCIDFEDFNSQHSNEAMKAVMRAYAKAFEHDLSPEQRLALNWAIQSVDATRILDNMGTGTEYDAKGTLMSGWRLTTFINSVLNYIYTMEMLGKVQTQFRSIHNGDDVLMGCNSMRIPVMAVREAKRRGIRLQRSKCSFGGLAEFLRIDHISGEMGQYLTRNIATLMHSRIESRIAVKATDVVEAAEERLAEFLVRGGDIGVAARLRRIYFDRVSILYHMTTAQFYKIKTSHRVVGGVSERSDSDLDYQIVTKNAPQEVELPEKMPGVVSYAEELHSQLRLENAIIEVTKCVRNATLKAIQMNRTSQTLELNCDVERYVRWRALYKAHSSDADKSLIGKAMMTGFAMDVLANSGRTNSILAVIAPAPDRLKFLSVIV